MEDTLKVTCDGDNNFMDLLDKMETVKNILSKTMKIISDI